MSHIDCQSVQYAIREAIRNHDGLRRTEVIERLAGLIDKRHPVNLTSPDKFILVEIFEVSLAVP